MDKITLDAVEEARSKVTAKDKADTLRLWRVEVIEEMGKLEPDGERWFDSRFTGRNTSAEQDDKITIELRCVLRDEVRAIPGFTADAPLKVDQPLVVRRLCNK